MKKKPKKTKKESFDLVKTDFFSNPFESFFRPFEMPNVESLFKPMTLPKTDITDKGKEIEVTADLPGIDKKDIKITINKNVLEIHAEKKEEKKTEKKSYYSHERSYSGFYRKYALPASIDTKKVKCSFSNGVLKITLQKIKETEETPKVITLK